MIIKTRKEPLELKLLRQLYVRSNLTETEQSYYWSLEKGYQGELQFDIVTESLSPQWLIINDLMLEYNQAVFQNDTILITSGKIIICEVKNYEGDYMLEDGKWCTLAGTEIRNPLHQVERNELLIRKLLEGFGVTIPVEKYLIFINPAYYLYEAPRTFPIIFPSQLNRFIKQLSKNSTTYNETDMYLAKRLASLHIEKSPYMRLPSYSYDQLQKGIICKDCHSLQVEVRNRRLVCNACGCKEELSDAVLRGMEEFSFLFPDRKITISESMAWIKVIESRVTMRRLLSKHYKQKGQGRYSYYVKE